MVVGGHQSAFHRPADRVLSNGQSTPVGVSQISKETEDQLAFPHHTFVIVNMQTGDIERQHTLILNPTDFTQSEPVRGQVVQTLGGAYVDDFGRGLPEVTIQGNTGWRLKNMPDGKGILDGWQAFKALRSDIFRYYTDAKDEVRTFLHNPNYELRWYNWGEDEYYAIHPKEFQLQRSASNPLLYQYSFPFTCLRDLRREWGGKEADSAPFRPGAKTSVKDAAAAINIAVTALGALAAILRGE